MKKVSIVIPTFQRCESIKRLLTALSLQTFPHDDFEVIVSIDGSEDGTMEMVEQFPSPYKLRALWERNSGRASACNRGVNKAEGDILIILDDDMEPSNELIQEHYTSHEADTKLGVIGAAPISLDQNSTLAAHYIAAEFNARLKKISKPDYCFRIWDFYGANFSIRREVFIEVGAFNESFKLYGYEDIELAQRLIKIGVNFMFNPKALCTQYYEGDFKELAKKTVNGGKMAVLLVNMHPETFTELNFRNYNRAGKKWRALRHFLIWSSMLIPATTDAVIFFVSLYKKSNSEIQEKVYYLALDYLFWLGVWSVISSDKNNKQLIDKIKSYEIPKKKPTQELNY